MSPRAAGSAVLGVALTPTGLAAAPESAPPAWVRGLELDGNGNGSREALREALRDAARATGVARARLVVALVPPLAELRAVSLPPLDEDDRNRFLARNAGRYFVSARGAQVVGTAAPRAARGATGEMPVLAAAASQHLLSALEAAAQEAGVRLAGVIPAESAWAVAAVAIWPELARGAATVVVARDERVDLLTIRDGELLAVRRCRGARDARAIVDAAGAASRIGVLGAPAAGHAVADALKAAGARVLAPDASWATLSERPDALAARFAPAATTLLVRTDESIHRERANAARLARWLTGAAAAALVLAGAVHYAGLRRELASVRAARADIRSQVEATLVGRLSVDATYRQVAALARTSHEAPRWSALLAALAAQLPDDASLTAFRARGDSIFLDGVAERAAPVFDHVARTPGIAGVRATAPVRRESVEGEAPLEHFAVGARVAGWRP